MWLFAKILQWILDCQYVNYFAYGPNMSLERIQSRIGKVKRIDVFPLRGWGLDFSSNSGGKFCYANLFYDPNLFTMGVVYRITLRQLKLLDYYEGCPTLYNRFLDRLNDGTRVWVYIDPHRKGLNNQIVDTEYGDVICEGIKENLDFLYNSGKNNYERLKMLTSNFKLEFKLENKHKADGKV